jgi:hypothetical protein
MKEKNLICGALFALAVKEEYFKVLSVSIGQAMRDRNI